MPGTIDFALVKKRSGLRPAVYNGARFVTQETCGTFAETAQAALNTLVSRATVPPPELSEEGMNGEWLVINTENYATASFRVNLRTTPTYTTEAI